MTEYTDRISLNAGDKLELKFRALEGQRYLQKAVVEEKIGSGTSCLTYIVRLFTDEKNSSRMIMKEFYPVSEKEKFHIKREGTKLLIEEDTVNSRIYQEMREAFRRAYRTQAELADSSAMEVMVHPYHMAEYGDSIYILSDMHLGTILARSKVQNLSEKLWLIYRTAEAVQLLNEQGYLYMDLNPSNILWIPSQQSVKLFDVDSIVPWHELDSIHNIRVTYPYTPPELEELNEWFDVNKTAFLKPSWDVYCLGLISFELIMGRFPTDEDLKTGYGNEYETDQICRQYGCDDPEAAALMRKILSRSLSRKFRMRYPSAREMCRDLNRLKKMLDAQEFIPKKEYARANSMMQSYHILDKWPVYEHTLNEDGEEVLDVAICGKQPMREAFFKAVFSCVHMPGMKLRIRLYAEDAADFMDRLKRENPALIRTVHIYREDECVWDENNRLSAGPRICEEPMAEIRLYEKSREEMLSNDAAIIRSIRSRYLLLLWNDADDIIRSGGIIPKTTAAPPVSDVKKCSYYDEELFGTRIMKWALNIHAFYYRGSHERASREEIRDSFENDVYNLDSSMRSALSVRYKLGALGIDTDCETPGEEFYRRVFAVEKTKSEELIAMLSSLEHLSWCAYMVINGWDLPTDGELEQYAFAGGNDFKDKKRRLHPCLVPARPGNHLRLFEKKDWNRKKLSRKFIEGLDDLDLVSLKLHQIAGKKALEIRSEINQLCDSLQRKIHIYQSERLQEAFVWLVTVRERVFAGESNAELVWKQAMEQLREVCDKICRYDRSIHESLKVLYNRMKVVHEYNSYHDYKKSDEDIVCGVPQILSDGCIRTVFRPYVSGRENHWKNILSVLFLEPEEVFFVPMDEREINVEFYNEFLRFRGSSTKLSVCGFEDITYVGADSVIDVTGLDAEELGRLYQHPVFRDKRRVMVKNRRLLGLDDPMVEMYAREIHLTVEEMFYLFGAYMDSDRKENAILGLSSRYHGIWNAYKEIGAWGWKEMIEQLVHIEGENTVALNEGDKGKTMAYKTAPVSGRALVLTGLDLIFAACLEKGLIASYWIPVEGDDLPAEFSTGSRNIAQILEKLVIQAEREPVRHKYIFTYRDKLNPRTQEKERHYQITDRTLYVNVCCGQKTLTDPSGKGHIMSDIFTESLRIVEKNGLQGAGCRQNLIQNLQISPSENGVQISFKYASDAVKACLQREENILEAMIYFTCLGMGIFDDLNINSEFSWNTDESDMPNECTVNNEVDIIGTRNLKTYFISAKMTVPETAHLMEIRYFADHFGIDGQAVLVTSNSRTADELIARQNGRKERSRLMEVKYINRTVIDEGRLGEVIRAIIEKGDEDIL